MDQYTYLFVMLFTISVPLILSFERRLYYVQYWKALFGAILPVAILFIAWDILFTQMNIWAFNSQYILGVNIVNLPIEECSFFFLVPFSCTFIYEVLNWYFKKPFIPQYARFVTLALAISFLILGIIHFDKMYTLVTFELLGTFMLYLFLAKQTEWIGNFYRAFLVSLIPFFIVNGILTGMPVVTYNYEEQLGILMFTIPLEDAFYGMLMLMSITWLYEIRKKSLLVAR